MANHAQSVTLGAVGDTPTGHDAPSVRSTSVAPTVLPSKVTSAESDAPELESRAKEYVGPYTGPACDAAPKRVSIAPATNREATSCLRRLWTEPAGARASPRSTVTAAVTPDVARATASCAARSVGTKGHDATGAQSPAYGWSIVTPNHALGVARAARQSAMSAVSAHEYLHKHVRACVFALGYGGRERV